MSSVIDKIVLSHLFLESEEDTALWELTYGINTIFPENSTDQNLAITKHAVIWMYETGKITFFSDNKDKERLFFSDKRFLYNDQNWDLCPDYNDALLVITTDQGMAYYLDFRIKFINSIISGGLIRQGKKYYLDTKLKKHFSNIGSHFFISYLVRILGMQPIPISPYLVQHTDNNPDHRCTSLQCIVDTRTNLITDISRIT